MFRTFLLLALFFPPLGLASSLKKQNESLFEGLKKEHNLSDAQMAKIKAIFARSGVMSQGNPVVTEHPHTEAECREKVKGHMAVYDSKEDDSICGGKFMSPLYKTGAKKSSSEACIDKFEFPNIPCTYPVTWVRANEAAEICNAMGKRLCDAHEWEGACAGSLEEPQYRFDLVNQSKPAQGIKAMRSAHNRIHNKNKVWAYGKSFKKGICAQNSFKHKGCNGGNFKKCGTNTYPTGFFPECSSNLNVYDIHGNAAEHMNLPVNEGQMASKGSKTLGHTEMKGSWFIWDKFQAHQDHCRWRAPYWHGTTVMHKKSHHNYHLGFRCCRTIEKGKKK